MPGRREYTRAIAAADAIYVLGGGCQFRGAATAYQPFADCFRLNLSVQPPSWQSFGKLTVPRTHMGVGRVGNYLVVAGGNQYDAKSRGYRSSTIRGTTDVFDLSKPQKGWQQRAPIPGKPRGWVASAVCGQRLYVLGGLTYSNKGKQIRISETLCYDPATDRWTSRTPPPVPISGWEGATYADRYLIVVGGVIASPKDPKGHLWNDLPLVYDTQKDRWLKVDGPLPPGALFNDPGVCILDDKIYVTGAEGPDGSHFDYLLIGNIKPQ
jgi:hypothetical protein